MNVSRETICDFRSGKKWGSFVNLSVGFCFALFAVTGWLFNPSSIRAQGTLSILETGGSQPLVSDNVLLQTSAGVTPKVDFDFGFYTDEAVSPGQFLDSLTVSFTYAASDVAVVATVDASGTYWEPVTPGGVALTPDELQWQPIPPPSQSPVLGQGVGYAVQVSLPPSFANTTVTATFSLFDNQNPSAMAIGWFENVQVQGTSVPEPSGAVLAMLATAMCAAGWRNRK